jgi:hypothetical protein
VVSSPYLITNLGGEKVNGPQPSKENQIHIKTYQEQSNTFLLAKLSETRANLDIVKGDYVKSETSRLLWKLTSLILAAILLGRFLGGTL